MSARGSNQNTPRNPKGKEGQSSLTTDPKFGFSSMNAGRRIPLKSHPAYIFSRPWNPPPPPPTPPPPAPCVSILKMVVFSGGSVEEKPNAYIYIYIYIYKVCFYFEGGCFSGRERKKDAKPVLSCRTRRRRSTRSSGTRSKPSLPRRERAERTEATCSAGVQLAEMCFVCSPVSFVMNLSLLEIAEISMF